MLISVMKMIINLVNQAWIIIIFPRGGDPFDGCFLPSAPVAIKGRKPAVGALVRTTGIVKGNNPLSLVWFK